MRRIAIIVVGVLVLAIGALLVLPQLIPSDVYRERIQTAASSALGRDVTVTGEVKVRVFPRIEARAGSTTIANPEGFGDAPFASMGELRAAVKLIPLIFQRVEIDEFILVEPNIALVAKEDGTNNWTFNVGGQPSSGSGGSGTGKLEASLGDVRIIDGQVSFDDRAAGQVHTLANLDLRARMNALDKPFDIEANGTADQIPFELTADIENPKAMLGGEQSNLRASLSTDLVKFDVDGLMSLGETPQFDFAFDGDIPSATELAAAFQVVGMPPSNVLGRVTASGRATGTPDNILLKIDTARHASALVNADLTGAVTLAEAMTFDLNATADIPKLSDLAQAMNIEAPRGGVLGKATASAHATGAIGDIQFTDVDLRHDSALLALTYTGNARMRDQLTYAGRISISAPDLKQLASAAGTKLPAGDIYRSFSLTGDTTGGASNLMLKNAVVEFDNIRGTGEAALALGAKPRLTGALNTGPIDITPYAAASGAPKTQPAAKSKGWGETPIDLTPLRMADAQITMNADSLKFRQFDFGPSKLNVNLQDGRLLANVDQTTLFGGVGGLQLVADGSAATPVIGLKANMNGLAMQPLLKAAANFGMMEGTGDLIIDVSGTGSSLNSFMQSLQGQGALAFDQGTLNGIDLNTLAASAKTALTSKSVPVSAFGADATTAFRDLKANFSMQDGVAAIANMKLSAGQLAVNGGGSLDIGAQTVSFTIFPEFVDGSSGVNGYGLPVKFSGGWDGVRASLDFDWLVKRATADVKTRVQDEIQNELRESLGSELSGILGRKPAVTTPTATTGGTPAVPAADGAEQAAAPATETETPVTEPPAEAPPANVEDALKREAGRALGDLLRNKK